MQMESLWMNSQQTSSLLFFFFFFFFQIVHFSPIVQFHKNISWIQVQIQVPSCLNLYTASHQLLTHLPLVLHICVIS